MHHSLRYSLTRSTKSLLLAQPHRLFSIDTQLPNKSERSQSSKLPHAPSDKHQDLETMPMASFEAKRLASSTKSSPSSLDSPILQSTLRRQSSDHYAPPTTSPKVQLIPHSRTLSYDNTLLQSEKELLANTNFDDKDLSSQDFEFEEVFTYDRPQKKLNPVVEVSTRAASSFSDSYFKPPAGPRQQVYKTKSTVGELYMRNHHASRKR